MSFMKKTGKALSSVPGISRLGFDPELGTVFVTSGSGVIGYRVAMKLLEAGHKSVRVGIWRGDRQIGDKSVGQECADNLAAAGAEVVDFDWANEDNHGRALEGVKTVFCTIPHMKNWQEVFPMFLRACKKAGVDHFVKISCFGSDKAKSVYQGVPFVQFHGTCDDMVKLAKSQSGISYTILCASHIMATPLIQMGPVLREQKKFVTASYGMGVNYISPNDVADAAVVCLLNRKEHRNKEYTLTAAQPITDKEVAKLLSEFYGTEIEHVPLGYHEFKKYVQNLGHPDWLVKDAAEFERIKASGIDESVHSYTNHLEKIIGRQPETFRDYLSNKESMTPAWRWPTETGK